MIASCCRRTILTLVAIALTAVPAMAQEATFPTTPRFQTMVRLAQDGRGDSARAMITEELRTRPENDPLYAEALYTAATIAASGDDARLFFSRVAVEHGSSAWADKALLRLAQLDYGRGDPDGTMARVERLMLDYPNSAVLPDAALWGARAAFERRELARGCGWLTRGLEVVGANVELKNQIEYTAKRCAAGEGVVVLMPTPDSLRAKPAAPRTPEVTPSDRTPVRQPATGAQPTGPWRVQVAALTDPAAIRRTEDAIRRLGLTPSRVAGPNGMTKVQAGPFASREAAQARVDDLGRAVGSRPFVVRVD